MRRYRAQSRQKGNLLFQLGDAAASIASVRLFVEPGRRPPVVLPRAIETASKLDHASTVAPAVAERQPPPTRSRGACALIGTPLFRILFWTELCRAAAIGSTQFASDRSKP
jgi:hypothetical protein